jgi:hypothetical protein
MPTERYEVVKFNKRTGKRVPGMFFSGSSQDETQRRADEMNAKLSAGQKEEVEFRCCSADPFDTFSMGPMPRP